jgi:peptide/nickel transport system permease protein
MTVSEAQSSRSASTDLMQGSTVDFRPRSGLRYFVRRFASENPLNVVALGIIAIFLFLSRLGTDELGRDVLSRVMAGTRISLGIATLILSIAITAGVVIGAISGYVGGWVDEVLMRFTDIFLAFPALILAMGIAASLGRDLKNVIIALTLVYWPWYARLIRGQVLMIRERDFVEAARAIGSRPSRVLIRHILPNTIAPIIVQATVDVGYAVLATAGLSFIGLGAQPPSPEWGSMIAGARTYFRVAWWYMTFPGLALTFTVVGFNLLGDGLRDYFDPRTRSN